MMDHSSTIGVAGMGRLMYQCSQPEFNYITFVTPSMKNIYIEVVIVKFGADLESLCSISTPGVPAQVFLVYCRYL